MAIQNIPPALPPALVRKSSGSGEVQQASSPATVDPVQRTAAAAELAKLQEALRPADTPPAASPAREQIDRAMSEVKKALDPVARNLQFSIDEETGRTVIKVVDSTTQQVIRQMPSEELLALTRSLDSLSGLFVKQKA